jgi:hypothetical protein
MEQMSLLSEDEYREALAAIERDEHHYHGFATWKEYVHYLALRRGFKDYNEYRNYLTLRKGFSGYAEYRDAWAQKHGFKDYNEHRKHLRHVTGRQKPMSENKDCSLFLGVHVAERVLSNVFKNVQRMPQNNPGYDFICSKGYKIDVKSASLCKILDKKHGSVIWRWNFHIRNNTIADYFLLIAFDDRENLNPMHVWLIKGSEL